ncbi:MAG TPA: NUDIX hydrolase [Pyrinomonadaceae bacterium]|nr:NUDIX hydrolase [Pyrinomonadaceae bacterium]
MQNSPDTWKIKQSEPIADCKIFKVRRDLSESSKGQESNFFVIENPDWVNVIAMTKDQKVVIIEQFRHGTGEITIEIPGGMVDADEEASTAAKRELVEETGYTPRELISLGKCRPNPAIQDNWLYHFLAVDCEKTHEVEFDSTESVVTRLVDFVEFSEMIATEQISHSAVLVAFLKSQIHLQRSIE